MIKIKYILIIRILIRFRIHNLQKCRPNADPDLITGLRRELVLRS